MKVSILNKANIIRVLRIIWLNEGISRVEIAEKLGLDKSTITNIVNDLKSRMVIIEVEEGRAGPQGGRKPIKLKILKNFCAVLGIEVQPEYCDVHCVNLSGEILISRKFPAEINAYSFKELFPEILDYAHKELEKMNIPLAGIGLGFSGIVNPVEGIIHESIPLGVTENFTVAEELSKLTELPVFIDNDANCCCWGELLCNRDEDLQDFLFCLVEFRDRPSEKHNYSGLAIGIGIVIGGKVHHGKNNTAGEFRSIFAGEEKPGQLFIESRAQSGIRDTASLFSQFAVELSRNLALLANTFALSDCFLGGDLGKFRKELVKTLKKELDNNWNYPGESLCSARYSSIGDSAVAYGAAAMIIEKLFTLPGIEDDVPSGLTFLLGE